MKLSLTYLLLREERTLSAMDKCFFYKKYFPGSWTRRRFPSKDCLESTLKIYLVFPFLKWSTSEGNPSRSVQGCDVRGIDTQLCGGSKKHRGGSGREGVLHCYFRNQ